MNVQAHKIYRQASATGLATVLALLAIPTAFAGGQAQGLDPAIATAMAAHLSSPTSTDRRLSDPLDPAIATAIAAHERLPVTSDFRSLDTVDAALAVGQSRW